MDAPKPLLLSEGGVYKQLGIITYHPKVQPSGFAQNDHLINDDSYKIPMVRVRLVQDVHALPNECTGRRTRYE